MWTLPLLQIKGGNASARGLFLKKGHVVEYGSTRLPMPPARPGNASSTNRGQSDYATGPFAVTINDNWHDLTDFFNQWSIGFVTSRASRDIILHHVQTFPRNLRMTVDIGPDKVWRYALSSGRTGTVFLEALMSTHAPGVTAVHEPAATRYQMILANLRNDFGIFDNYLQNIFERSRLQRENAATGIYVEINPFLCALTDLLPDPHRSLRVVHMVREPGSWARSIIAFKASRKYRWLIDYVPFAKPYPAPRPHHWHQLSEFEKALWRWTWCNKRIVNLREHCAAYVLIRYEDLFAQDIAQREAAIATIFDTLALPKLKPINWGAMSDRINQGPENQIEIDRDAVRRICGDLALDFGYAY